MSLYDTADRRRIKGSESMKNGWTLDATAEGKDYKIEVTESKIGDIGDEKLIRTTLGAELASMILKTREEFVKVGIPLANPDYVKFIEERQKQTKPLPKTTAKVSEKIPKEKKSK